MKPLLLSPIFLTAITFAAEGTFVRSIPAEGNRIFGQPAVSSPVGSADRNAFVGPTDGVFPHLATGGGWETIIVILNMSNASVPFKMRFYGQDGNPMPVTFRNYPELQLTTTAAAEGQLRPGGSFNFALFSSTPDTRVGWASLEYNATTTTRLGGYAIFRQKVTGRADYEAVVPLSAYDDFKFYMPFDNIQGFITAMALTNPASNATNRITIRARDLNGDLITQTEITLPPSGQTAFVLTDRLPELANRLGTIYVESSLNRLSGLGIRFNAAGGNAFSSIPILNWSGMF